MRVYGYISTGKTPILGVFLFCGKFDNAIYTNLLKS